MFRNQPTPGVMEGFTLRSLCSISKAGRAFLKVITSSFWGSSTDSKSAKHPTFHARYTTRTSKDGQAMEANVPTNVEVSPAPPAGAGTVPVVARRRMNVSGQYIHVVNMYVMCIYINIYIYMYISHIYIHDIHCVISAEIVRREDNPALSPPPPWTRQLHRALPLPPPPRTARQFESAVFGEWVWRNVPGSNPP